MKEEEEFNIFQPPPKKKEKPAVSSPVPPSNDKAPAYTASVEEMLQRMHEMHEDLRSKLDTIFEKSGMTAEQLEKHLEKTAADDLKRIEKEEKILESQISTALGAVIPKSKKSEREVQKKTKAHKGKTLGARKKWMPMR